MKDSKTVVWKLAQFLATQNLRMAGWELAHFLNRNGCLTSYGTKYTVDGGQGIHHLISCTYKWLDGIGLKEEANLVATAFVDSCGEYAYNK